ncbi:MAG: hypothetical protein JXQ75_21795 [Phycisphaerae bacterium]|nr:hypothetical protein [Phycisphaerae bacterium]
MSRQQAINYIEKQDSNSSVLDKTTSQLRREINKALVDRDPPTYKAVYAKFKLEKHGISYHAFYRYARRVRSAAAMFDMAEMTASAGTDLPAVLPKVLAQRLLEVLAFEDVSPRHIQRLADAYKTAVNAQVTIRRHGLFRNKGDKDAGCDIADAIMQYRDLVEHAEAVKTDG